MKKTLLIALFFYLIHLGNAVAQNINKADRAAVVLLIDQYSHARETRDTLLLKKILTSDVDQLVSSGEWRMGVQSAVKGMLRSSQTNEGERRLTVERIKLLGSEAAVADARYEIIGNNGSTRKMWSSFLLVKEGPVWKISGIRNMLPAGQ